MTDREWEIRRLQVKWKLEQLGVKPMSEKDNVRLNCLCLEHGVDTILPKEVREDWRK